MVSQFGPTEVVALTNTAYVFSDEVHLSRAEEIFNSVGDGAYREFKRYLKEDYKWWDEWYERLVQHEQELADGICEAMFDGKAISGSKRDYVIKMYEEKLKNSTFDIASQPGILDILITYVYQTLLRVYVEDLKKERATQTPEERRSTTSMLHTFNKRLSELDSFKKENKTNKSYMKIIKDLKKALDPNSPSAKELLLIKRHALSNIQKNTGMSREALYGYFSMGKGQMMESVIIMALGTLQGLETITDIGTKFSSQNVETMTQRKVAALLNKPFTTKGFDTNANAGFTEADMTFKFKNKLELGLSVKTTSSNKYLREKKLADISMSRITGTYSREFPVIKELAKNLSSLLMSEYIITKEEPKADRHDLMKIFTLAAFNEAIKEAAMVPATIHGPSLQSQFHYLISVNNKFYWFSDLVRSFKESVINFRYYEGTPKMTYPTNSVENYKLHYKKKLLVEELQEDYPTYYDRIPLFLEDQYIKNAINKAYNTFKSISIRVARSSYKLERRNGI